MQHPRHDRTVFAAALAWLGWWLLALWPLAGHWATNPQYAYGWLVPPLALLLAWWRWKTRPAPGASAAWAQPLMFCAALVMLPAWLIAQPNPGWRIVPWLLALSAVVGTIAFAAHAGGGKWARHFAFPAAFMLTAVPWPGFIEEPIIQGLMRFVASITVAVLGFAGVPAVQRGSLVEVATGVLGVDEACSGVRSLQAALMAALFLGELHRLRTGARCTLVAAGFLAALLANVARTSYLSLSAARDGIAAVDRFHDPAGYTVLSVCLAIIALLGEWLRARYAVRLSTRDGGPPHPLPVRTSVALAAWFAFAVLAAEAWYLRPTASATPGWTIAPPAGAEEQALPVSTLGLLGCDRTRAATWRDAAGARWTLYFLEWHPRRSRTALLAQVHRPDVCLPSVGLVESGERRVVRVSAAGFDLAFDSLHFRDPAGADAFVFYCPWEIVPGVGGRNVSFTDSTRTTSLRRVWQRERVVGQQVAELLITGAPSREAAEAALRRDLPALIQPIVPK